MTDFDVIDAKELFEYVQEGIVTENFEDARTWIRDNLEPRFAENPDQIVGIKKAENQMHCWKREDIDVFKSVLDKLEELYKKRNKA